MCLKFKVKSRFEIEWFFTTYCMQIVDFLSKHLYWSKNCQLNVCVLFIWSVKWLGFQEQVGFWFLAKHWTKKPRKLPIFLFIGVKKSGDSAVRAWFLCMKNMQDTWKWGCPNIRVESLTPAPTPHSNFNFAYIGCDDTYKQCGQVWTTLTNGGVVGPRLDNIGTGLWPHYICAINY
jgi:hypothetical protein